MTEPADAFTPEGAAPEALAVGTEPASQPDASAAAAEVAELKDRVLRTMAEMENLRRRTDKEVGDAKAYGVSSFARDMLTVADNLQRAQANLTDDVRRDLSAPLQSFIEGVELTERDFLSRLSRHGIKPIETAGQKFDPNKHEALFELPDPSVPPGTVVQVVETGYQIGERVLRPAKVGVARGGPRAEVAGDAAA